MDAALDLAAWPAERLGEALDTFAGRTMRGRGRGSSKAGTSDARIPPEGAGLGDWIEAVAAGLGLEADPVECAYPELDQFLRGLAPALLQVSPAPAPRFILITGTGKDRIRTLGPEGKIIPIDPEALKEALLGTAEVPEDRAAQAVLEKIGLEGKRAREAFRSSLLKDRRVGGAWILRPGCGADLRSLAREAHLGKVLSCLIAAHVVGSLLWVFSWWLLGRGALEGRLDLGWLLAWALVLLTIVPLRAAALRAAGIASIRGGAILRRRLLDGAFRLDPDDIRGHGAGQLLGRSMEVEVLESLALTGGLLAVTAAVELVIALPVLAAGASGALHALFLLAWTAAALGAAFLHARRLGAWTEGRLALAGDLVESMVGHRTRLAQEERDRWHNGEDVALERHHALSRAVDRTALILRAVVPRGWLIVGLLGLAPAFVEGSSTVGLAIGAGGVLLAYQAFRDLAGGLERLARGREAWKRVRLFLDSAGRQGPQGRPVLAASLGVDGEGTAAGKAGEDGRGSLLDARDIVFRHRGRAEPVLRGLNLRIGRRDRVLLEGPSGSGKSTLGKLLSGAQAPGSGLILLRGLDRETLGDDGWRRRVVLVPQFGENHIFLETLAFNLLLGRGWPPRIEDVREADEVCRALGLGPLLDRMPSGIFEVIGETGWQLSHGERSRVHLARALLQKPDLVVLDETFAALDPATLARALGVVLERTPALVVIAHP
jgi:ATP-binding cassette subfamily B protein